MILPLSDDTVRMANGNADPQCRSVRAEPLDSITWATTGPHGMISRLLASLFQRGSRHRDRSHRSPQEREEETRSRGGDEELVPEGIAIVRLLEDHGGVMWQGEITSEMDWSASTVSRRLSLLEEEERINRYRVGRRKLVCLPGHEPEFVDTTHRNDRIVRSSR